MFRNQSKVLLITKLAEFLSDTLHIVFLNNPDQLNRKDKTITYQEIHGLKSINEASDKFISKEVEKILREDHNCQIDYLDKRLKLGLKEQITCRPAFIEVTERRNLFVHNGSKVNRKYIEKCKQHNVKLNSKIKEGVVQIRCKKFLFLWARDCTLTSQMTAVFLSLWKNRYEILESQFLLWESKITRLTLSKRIFQNGWRLK